MRPSVLFPLLPCHKIGYTVKLLLVMGTSMARKTETETETLLDGDKLKKLAQRQQALQDELQAIKAKMEGAERKAQDREKVLLGVGVQEALSAGKMDRPTMVRLLDFLTPKDRAWMLERGWGEGGQAGQRIEPKTAKTTREKTAA